MRKIIEQVSTGRELLFREGEKASLKLIAQKSNFLSVELVGSKFQAIRNDFSIWFRPQSKLIQ
jgi:hypothetical protein